ncbi:S41 family peptidase [Xanthobacter sp. KR7-225]|uniref:S41 family peptidase n=1 Tax=Xanthobacter sp. KR7-225 TaxID=3156613 RepID=UPI0032B54E1F
MMRRTSLFIFGAAAGALVAFTVVQPRLFLGMAAEAASSDTYRQLDLFGDVFVRVRSDYVEKPEDSKLVESAIKGMLQELDPHSSYMDAKTYHDMQVQTSGEFGGLGIEVKMEDGLVKVIAPMEDTPAAKAGVMAGDLITKLNDEQVQGMTLTEAVDKMRGAVGAPIRLTIMRKGMEKPFEVKVTRAVIKIQAVRSKVEADDIAYIRINQFTQQTNAGLEKAIDNLTGEIGADKIRGYIIDLRNNPGGLLTQAVEVSSAFLDRGEVVSTRGRNPEESQRYNARGGDRTKGKPVIVLVNGGSASASEIVAGALQDHKRATVLGSRTFGKGSVQTIIPLGREGENGALRLTTARFYTPSGRSIQAKGIEPDIILVQDLPDEEKAKLGATGDGRSESSLKGHLKNGEEEQTGSPAYVPPETKDDTQLKLAIELMKGQVKNAAFPAAPEKTSRAN